MGKFEQQVKDGAKVMKTFLQKGFRVVGDSCKKGWRKVKHIRR